MFDPSIRQNKVQLGKNLHVLDVPACLGQFISWTFYSSTCQWHLSCFGIVFVFIFLCCWLLFTFNPLKTPCTHAVLHFFFLNWLLVFIQPSVTKSPGKCISSVECYFILQVCTVANYDLKCSKVNNMSSFVLVVV